MASRYFKSTVSQRILNAAMTNVSATMQLDSTAGIPSFPFTMVIAPDTATEEIVTVTGTAAGANTVNVTRGQDGTSAVAHGTTTDGASTKVRHMITARDLQDTFDHFDDTTNVHGITDTSTLITESNTKTLSNKTLSYPTVNYPTITQGTLSNSTLDSANFTNTNISGTNTVDSVLASTIASTVTLANSAWTTWTPTWSGTGASAGNATVSAKHKTIGKTVHFRISVTLGTTSSVSSSTTAFSLPSTPIAETVGQCISLDGTTRYAAEAAISTNGTVIPLCTPSTAGGASRTISTNAPFAWGSTDVLLISGTYEVA